jgi:hypothetical protein
LAVLELQRENVYRYFDFPMYLLDIPSISREMNLYICRFWEIYLIDRNVARQLQYS